MLIRFNVGIECIYTWINWSGEVSVIEIYLRELSLYTRSVDAIRV